MSMAITFAALSLSLFIGLAVGKAYHKPKNRSSI